MDMRQLLELLNKFPDTSMPFLLGYVKDGRGPKPITVRRFSSIESFSDFLQAEFIPGVTTFRLYSIHNLNEIILRELVLSKANKENTKTDNSEPNPLHSSVSLPEPEHEHQRSDEIIDSVPVTVADTPQ